MLTQERLKELLHYDPETGGWTWLVNRGPVRAGSPAGSWQWHYRKIGIDGEFYYSSHLAWLYMTGEWPPTLIDHKNTDRLDDRWDNLRLATKKQNAANAGLNKNNACGVKGVYRVGKRWRAMIKTDAKSIHIGYYDTAELAGQAYLTAAISLFGEFARSGD